MTIFTFDVIAKKTVVREVTIFLILFFEGGPWPSKFNNPLGFWAEFRV